MSFLIQQRPSETSSLLSHRIWGLGFWFFHLFGLVFWFCFGGGGVGGGRGRGFFFLHFFIAFYFPKISPMGLSGKTYSYRRIKGKKNTAQKTEVIAQTCNHHRIFHCFFPFYAFASLFWPQFAAFLLPHF